MVVEKKDKELVGVLFVLLHFRYKHIGLNQPTKYAELTLVRGSGDSLSCGGGGLGFEVGEGVG